MLRALAVVFALHAPAADPVAEAKNAAGFRALAGGHVVESVELFRAAVAADDKFALAHYNLACALSRARSAGKVCEVEAYRETIVDELKRAFALDPPHRAYAKTDPDLVAVHDTLGWQHLVLQRKLDRDEDIRAILVEVAWFGPSPGAYGPMSSAQFGADGKVTLTRRDVGGDMPRDVPVTGTFTVKAGAIEVTLGGKHLAAHLTWEGLVVDGWERFTDDPDDCSA